MTQTTSAIAPLSVRNAPVRLQRAVRPSVEAELEPDIVLRQPRYLPGSLIGWSAQHAGGMVTPQPRRAPVATCSCLQQELHRAYNIMAK